MSSGCFVMCFILLHLPSSTPQGHRLQVASKHTVFVVVWLAETKTKNKKERTFKFLIPKYVKCFGPQYNLKRQPRG